jgi:flagellum-specific peptidoglycan hydrolase FlgJ/LysM repeat protein
MCKFYLLSPFNPRNILAGLVSLGLSAPALASDDDIKMRKYIEDNRYYAVQEMKENGILASLKLAQGALESGYGTSELAQRANNHFGIKANHPKWQGEVYHVISKEYVNGQEISQYCPFRKYASVAEGYRDHSNKLRVTSNYRHIIQANSRDYNFWAKEIHRAGYATDPKYSDKLIALIERYQLYELDQVSIPVAPALDPSALPNRQLSITDIQHIDIRLKNAEAMLQESQGQMIQMQAERQALARSVEQNKQVEQQHHENQEQKIKILDERLADQYLVTEGLLDQVSKLEAQQQALLKSDPLVEHFHEDGTPKKPQFFKAIQPNAAGFFYISGKRVVALSPNADLRELSQVFKVPYTSLLKYNDIQNDELPLAPGFYVFLESKASTTKDVPDTYYHTVSQGETMHEISQLYGIQLETLLKRNKLGRGEEPRNGEFIFINKNTDRKPALRN